MESGERLYRPLLMPSHQPQASLPPQVRLALWPVRLLWNLWPLESLEFPVAQDFPVERPLFLSSLPGTGA